MLFVQRKALGGVIQIWSADREAPDSPPVAVATVATFGQDTAGQYAYAAFKDGLLRNGQQSELYDGDAGQYLVGSLGQLCGLQA